MIPKKFKLYKWERKILEEFDDTEPNEIVEHLLQCVDEEDELRFLRLLAGGLDKYKKRIRGEE